MGKGAPGPADHELAARVSELCGFEVGARQIERWREEGRLPKMVKTKAPSGKGTSARYPDGTLEHAACLAKQLKERKRLDEASLACFARGYAPRPGALKAVYKREFARIREWMHERADSGDPRDIAETVSRLLARRSSKASSANKMRKRLADAEQGAALADVLQNVISVVAGAPDARLHPVSFEAVGVMGFYRDKVGGMGPPAGAAPEEDSEAVSPFLNIRTFEQLVEQASLEDLEQARDDFRLIRAFAGAFGSTAMAAFGKDFGFSAIGEVGQDDYLAALIGVPIMLLIRGEFWSESAEEAFAMFHEQLPKHLAISNLIADLSPEHQRIIGTQIGTQEDEREALPEDQLEAFRSAVRAAVKAHPEDARLVLEEQTSDK